MENKVFLKLGDQELSKLNDQDLLKLKEEQESAFEAYLKWRDKNPDQPLFLPTGSVRAIITIAIVIFCCVLIHEGKIVPEWFSSVVAMSIAYYFGGRSDQTK